MNLLGADVDHRSTLTNRNFLEFRDSLTSVINIQHQVDFIYFHWKSKWWLARWTNEHMKILIEHFWQCWIWCHANTAPNQSLSGSSYLITLMFMVAALPKQQWMISDWSLSDNLTNDDNDILISQMKSSKINLNNKFLHFFIIFVMRCPPQQVEVKVEVIQKQMSMLFISHSSSFSIS